MRIAAIGAHLDDIELACGGTLAAAVRKGHQVKMIVMSRSEYRNWDGKVMRTLEEADREGRLGAEVLGVKDLEILDLPNKRIPFSPESIEVLDEKLALFQPDLIFTHWAFDTHQDHVATAKSVIAAARYFNSILMFEPIAPSGRSYAAFRPQVYFDIAEGIEKKTESLKAHFSQYEKYGQRWIDATVARARYRGFEIGKKYAECFEVVRYEAVL